MNIIKNITLLNNKPNYFDFSQNTIDAHKIASDQLDYIYHNLKSYVNKSTSHQTNKYIKYYLDNHFEYLDFVAITKYPMPAAYNTQTSRCVINISASGKRNVQGLNIKDIYAMIVYAHTCRQFSHRPVRMQKINPSTIAQFYSAIFLKIYAKRYGIIGSYADMMPAAKFLIFTYIFVSFYQLNKNKAMQLASNLSSCDYKSLDINVSDYDFTTIADFFKAMSDQEVTAGLNSYIFLNTMINIFGSYNIGMFEDLMRFCSTIFASSVGGNTLFTPAFASYNNTLYLKIINGIDDSLK